jgi:hypothetical protein
MKIGIVGSRRRKSLDDKNLILYELSKLTVTELVSGGCKIGADNFAEEISTELNIPIKIFYPKITNNMSYYQRVECYFSRNKEISEYSDILIAVVSNDRTGGTENTIKHFNRLKKRLILLEVGSSSLF